MSALDNSILNSSRRILVVDDDDSVRELCSLVLRTAGYSVETAVHGADGLEKLRRSVFDLVISDINMPELGGIEFYAAAENEALSVKDAFLFMTGAASEEQLEALSDRGLHLLEKPFRISDLLGMVEGLMREPLKTALGENGGCRKEGRLCFTDDCGIVMRGSVVCAETRDISPHGLRARYRGRAIEAGANVTVIVSVNGLSFERGARAVWTEERPEGFESGMEFNCPMPVSSIINIPMKNQELN